MKMKLIFAFFSVALVLLLSFEMGCKNKSTPQSSPDESGFIEIFNGENLNGWINHGEEKWYVENGELICESGPKKEYGYLSTEEFYDDFELKLKFKQEANGNSGVFFRSTLEGTKITGWQVEVAPPEKHTGGIYESYGRGWLIQPRPEKDNALKMGEWNDMRILVVGDKVTTWVNGTEMISMADAKIGMGKGAIALQIHDGGGIKVRWKDISVRVINASNKSEEEAALASEWIELFNGKGMDGWRAYNSDKMPPRWKVEDEMLTFDTELKLEEEWTGGNDIIYAKEEFDNFELSLEWKVGEGGNSGIFYHLQEGFDGPWQISPEYQLLDEEGWERLNNAELESWQKTGADYAMYPVQVDEKVLNPGGEWNTSRIVFTEELASYYLNGKKMLSFIPWSDDWKQRKEKGKWKNYPDYGKFKKGFIGLQDHDSPVWFKNIRIRKL